MNFREQNKIFEDLIKVERTIKGKDQEHYRVLKLRHKNDEDLDELSSRQLLEIYEKYYINRKRHPFPNPFEN